MSKFNVKILLMQKKPLKNQKSNLIINIYSNQVNLSRFFKYSYPRIQLRMKIMMRIFLVCTIIFQVYMYLYKKNIKNLIIIYYKFKFLFKLFYLSQYYLFLS